MISPLSHLSKIAHHFPQADLWTATIGKVPFRVILAARHSRGNGQSHAFLGLRRLQLLHRYGLVCDGGMTQLANRWPAKKQLGPNSRDPL